MPKFTNGDIRKSDGDMSKLGADLYGNQSMRRCSRTTENSERRVLVIYTGGTIGMVKTEDGKNSTNYTLLSRSLFSQMGRPE